MCRTPAHMLSFCVFKKAQTMRSDSVKEGGVLFGGESWTWRLLNCAILGKGGPIAAFGRDGSAGS